MDTEEPEIRAFISNHAENSYLAIGQTIIPGHQIVELKISRVGGVPMNQITITLSGVTVHNLEKENQEYEPFAEKPIFQETV